MKKVVFTIFILQIFFKDARILYKKEYKGFLSISTIKYNISFPIENNYEYYIQRKGYFSKKKMNMNDNKVPGTCPAPGSAGPNQQPENKQKVINLLDYNIHYIPVKSENKQK